MREIVFREYNNNGDLVKEVKFPMNFASGYKAIQLAQGLADLLGFERITNTSLFGGYWRDSTLSKIIEIY